MESIKIICGPIIGAVTCHTARIVVEVESDCELTMFLMSDDTLLELTLQVKKRFPTVFKFINLTPSTTYAVSFKEAVIYSNPILAKQTADFRTMPEEVDDIKIGFISCNSVRTEFQSNKSYSMWYHLAAQVKSFDYIFHHGDQVYLDEGNVFRKGEQPDNVYIELKYKYKNMSIEEIKSFEVDIRETIQEEYRRTWTYEPIAFILKNVPNYMMFDDHDIHDDFGFNPKFCDKDDFGNYFAKEARYCYYLYQRQLREDIDFSDFSKIDREFYWVNLGGICVFVLDFRGCRTWHKIVNDPLKLSTKQWYEIEDCFGRNGMFSKPSCKCAIMVTTTPPVYLSGNQLTELITGYENDVYEQWSLDCSDEQQRLLKILSEFKTSTKKPLTLVTGDVHICGLTEIYRSDSFMFKQFITSGIKQKTFSDFQMKVLRNVVNHEQNVNNEFTFKHEGFSNDNNYGIIEISKSNNYEIMCRHARSREENKILPFITNRKSLNRQTDRAGCQCCLII
jgi:alkaline phosphatase D